MADFYDKIICTNLKENSFMSFYLTNELPPKKKISSVQSNPMKHCTEYSVI